MMKDLMREIKCLKDLGIEPDVAEFLIYKKYGYDEIADNSIQNWDEDTDDLKYNTYKYLVPFETNLGLLYPHKGDESTLENDKEKRMGVLYPIKEDFSHSGKNLHITEQVRFKEDEIDKITS